MITLEKLLNHEVATQHVLIIEAQDKGPSAKRSLATVVVYVIDSNDNTPRFLATEYEGDVAEGSAPGTVVKQVKAIDKDHGKNAEITYTIVSGELTLGHSKEVSSHLSLHYNIKLC